MNPLEQLATQDVEARERVLGDLRAWSRANAGRYTDCSLVLHGSAARGDYWADGDIDLLLHGGVASARVALEAAFRQSWVTVHPTVTIDLWVLDQTIETFNLRTTEQRKLPNPIQFGLYGFDLARHHVVLVGTDFLAPFAPAMGSDLTELAKDRLVKLVTPGAAGYGDSFPKKAMESLKAAAILIALANGRRPSRDKRTALTTFLSGTAALAIPQDIAVRAWSAYRYRTEPPPPNNLQEFVEAVVAAFR